VSADKITGDTQLGCVPMLAMVVLAVFFIAISHAVGKVATRVDAIEKSLAAKEQSK